MPERINDATTISGPSSEGSGAGGQVVAFVSCGRNLLPKSRALSAKETVVVEPVAINVIIASGSAWILSSIVGTLAVAHAHDDIQITRF